MKTEDETMPTKPVQDNYFSRGVRLKRTFEMKDKFETAISDNVEALNEGSICGVNKAAKRCNTLHQQAMKIEKKKLLNELKDNVKEEWASFVIKRAIIKLLQRKLDNL